MVAKKAEQSLMRRRASRVAWVVACVAFVTLAILGVSSVVRAVSLEAVANEGVLGESVLGEVPEGYALGDDAEDVTSVDPDDPSGLAEPFAAVGL